MHQENDKVERYKTYLRLEKALSANSIDAYLTDLDKLTNFVESEGKKYADVTYDDLQQFVARLHDIGIHPRSQARIISGEADQVFQLYLPFVNRFTEDDSRNTRFSQFFNILYGTDASAGYQVKQRYLFPYLLI